MTEKKLNYRQQQALDTREKIYNTTLKLFYEQGFDTLTIKKICQEANVAVGTFYLYFSSKQDILFEAYRSIDSQIEDLHLEVPTKQSWLSKIEALIAFQVKISLEIDRSLIRQVYSYQILSNHVESTYSEDRSIFKVLSCLLEKAQSSGELPTTYSPNILSHKILRLSRGLIFDWLSHDCTYDLETLCIDELKFLIHALQNVPSKKS